MLYDITKLELLRLIAADTLEIEGFMDSRISYTNF